MIIKLLGQRFLLAHVGLVVVWIVEVPSSDQTLLVAALRINIADSFTHVEAEICNPTSRRKICQKRSRSGTRQDNIDSKTRASQEKIETKESRKNADLPDPSSGNLLHHQNRRQQTFRLL